MTPVIITIKKVTFGDVLLIKALCRATDDDKIIEDGVELLLRHTNLTMDDLLSLEMADYVETLRQVVEGIGRALKGINQVGEREAPWEAFTRMLPAPGGESGDKE